MSFNKILQKSTYRVGLATIRLRILKISLFEELGKLDNGNCSRPEDVPPFFTN